MKKGISPVVATVLLVLVTVMAVVIVANIIIPLVKNQIKSGEICFEGREHFKVVDSEYTCYNDTHTKMMIKRGVKDLDIVGVSVGIFSKVEGKVYSLTPKNPDNIKMLKEGDFSNDIVIPETGEARTYLFDTGGGEVELSLIYEDGKCDPLTYTVQKC